jgi:hypothetical protein
LEFILDEERRRDRAPPCSRASRVDAAGEDLFAPVIETWFSKL